MARGQSWHVGLTRLVPSVRGGRWLTGILIFGFLSGCFALAGVLGDTPGAAPATQSAAWFFCVVIAYIVPVFHYISERTVQAIDRLGPELDSAEGSVAALRERVYYKPRRWFAKVLSGGFAAAVAHNVAIILQGGMLDRDWSARFAITGGGTLTWVVLTLVIFALIDNAALFNRLARRVRLNPLTPERLHPFALVAVLSTLALVGAQAAFPILILDEETDAIAFLPGLVATMVPMFVLAVLPVWPLHVRLRAAKRELLADVNARISLAPAPQGTVGDIGTLAPLLTWRREVTALPDWPFDTGTVGRLVLYLIIPPLTWVGAALIQHVVERFL
jgi:hypothetical protein